MFLLLHPGDLDWSQLKVMLSFLVLFILLGIPFLALTIWMVAQTIIGFKKDARRKRQRAEKP